MVPEQADMQDTRLAAWQQDARMPINQGLVGMHSGTSSRTAVDRGKASADREIAKVDKCFGKSSRAENKA